MAINVKTLTIGSHVSIGGKRVKVLGICDHAVAYPGTVVKGCKSVAKPETVEPIEITPALLEELGFEEDKTDIVKRVDGYYICFHQINNLRWRVSLEEENCTSYGNTLCHYLHEAETFLALHGIELIPD